MMKYLVGGYYSDIAINGGSDEYITPYTNDVKMYTVEEAIKLGFVENVVEWYEDNDCFETGAEWEELSDADKASFIVSYTEDDEIAGLELFECKQDAIKYVNECKYWLKNQ